MIAGSGKSSFDRAPGTDGAARERCRRLANTARSTSTLHRSLRGDPSGVVGTSKSRPRSIIARRVSGIGETPNSMPRVNVPGVPWRASPACGSPPRCRATENRRATDVAERERVAGQRPRKASTIVQVHRGAPCRRWTPRRRVNCRRSAVPPSMRGACGQSNAEPGIR